MPPNYPTTPPPDHSNTVEQNHLNIAPTNQNLAQPPAISPQVHPTVQAPPSVISLGSTPSPPGSPTIEAQRLGDDIPSHLIHEQEGWQCCCDNTTLVARYEERIAACEVLLQEFHRHLVAQQAESQSLRAELVAQRGWWDKLAQLFAGH